MSCLFGGSPAGNIFYKEGKTVAAKCYLVAAYTVSWRLRIFNCIEEVPRFFFPIEFNSTF